MLASGLMLAAFAPAVAAENHSFVAETGGLIDGATKVIDGAALGSNLVALTMPGHTVKFSSLPAASKLAIRYASVGVGTISVAVNDQSPRKVNIHSSGALTNSFLNAIIDVAIPAKATLTISVATNDVAVNIDRIIVGDGDLGLPPDIWNLPPLPVADGPYSADWKAINEGGVGRTTEWSVVPLPTSPDNFRWPDMTAGDLGSRAKLKPGSHLRWFPAEINVTILANGAWFWAPQKHPRSLSELVDIYYRSIGRNGNLILNLSPDSRGLIPDDELDALSKMSQIVKDTFATDLALGGILTADNSNRSHKPSRALDRNFDTWWEAAPGKTNATLTLTLRKPATFDVVSLQEAVDHRGQRIESFAIDFWNGSDWSVVEKISSDTLTTVGHRRLIRFKSPVTTDQLRIRIIGSRMEPTLAEIGLFKQSAAGLPPTISGRDTNGLVTLSNDGNCKMVYTVDGTAPTTDSPVYHSPIVVPTGGTVQAACLMPNGQLGIVASRPFASLPPNGWKVVAVNSQETAGENNAAANAIDGNTATFWHTRWNEDLMLPHFITVDMGRSHRMAGFTYLPRRTETPTAPLSITVLRRAWTETTGRPTSSSARSPTFGTTRRSRVLISPRSTPGFSASRPYGKSMRTARRARRKFPSCPPAGVMVGGDLRVFSGIPITLEISMQRILNSVFMCAPCFSVVEALPRPEPWV